MGDLHDDVEEDEEEEGSGGNWVSVMERENRAKRLPLVPHSLLSSIYFCQMVGILALADFNWPSPGKEAIEVFTLSNLTTDVVGVSCTFRGFRTRYLLAMMVPLVMLLILSVSMLILRVLRVSGINGSLYRRVLLSGG